LSEGSADLGIIPAAAYAQIPGLQILPDVAIASRRAVRSILLVSQIPVELVRTVALDTSSMTSVALTKILFEKWLGGGREFVSMEPNIEKMLEQCDAGLLIGDPALQVDRRKYHTIDLAEEWIRYTGKPFVFAFWAVRGEALQEGDPKLDLATIFRESRDHGLQPESLARLEREWAPRVGLTESDVHGYLTENIHYQLDSGCLQGLRLFYQYATEIGALSTPDNLKFVESLRTAV
jgi:chorismate dehydratase